MVDEEEGEGIKREWEKKGKKERKREREKKGRNEGKKERNKEGKQ